MKITLQVPDELAEKLARDAAEIAQPVEQYMVEQLVRWHDLTPKVRVLVLTGAPLLALETQLGGYLATTDRLVDKVRALAGLQIGTHHIEFTPGQWEEIQHRAKKRGITVAEEIRQIWHKLQSEFFQYV